MTCCNECKESGEGAERYGGPACMNPSCPCHKSKGEKNHRSTCHHKDELYSGSHNKQTGCKCFCSCPVASTPATSWEESIISFLKNSEDTQGYVFGSDELIELIRKELEANRQDILEEIEKGVNTIQPEWRFIRRSAVLTLLDSLKKKV